MLSFQKFAYDRTGLRYDFSFPNIASSSTTVFVSPANNVNSENSDVKIDLASENISVITMELQDILDQVTTSC